MFVLVFPVLGGALTKQPNLCEGELTLISPLCVVASVSKLEIFGLDFWEIFSLSLTFLVFAWSETHERFLDKESTAIDKLFV